MILKGSERGGSAQLAAHLLNTHDNDHVELHSLRGFLADELFGAFQEIQAIALGTKCRKFMFSLSLNPPENEEVSIEAFEEAIENIERRLGLSGLPRVIVFHEKQGLQGYRRHAHCVWSRIDGTKMRAVNISHYKRKLTEISRSLYQQYGWPMPLGLQKAGDRNPLNYTLGEYSQAKRAKRDPKDLKCIFAECWQRSDSRAAFASALKEQGFILAKGDRRGHVAIDQNGEIYAISRWVGIKAKEVRNVLGLPDDLPSVEEALTQIDQSAQVNQDFNPPSSPQKHDATARPNSLITDVILTELQGLADKRCLLIETQRQERIDLKQRHKSRHVLETKSRSKKLPHGLKAVWYRLSGQYQDLINHNETDAKRCDKRDRSEWQSLINAQLQANRSLNQQIILLRQRLRSLSHNDETAEALSGGNESNPFQTLVIPPDPEARSVKVRVEANPVHVLSVLTDTKETFTRNTIVRKLADYIDDPLKLGTAVDCVMRSNELAEIEGDLNSGFTHKERASKRRSAKLYSTVEFQGVKSRLRKHIVTLSKIQGRTIDKRYINDAIKYQNRMLKDAIGADLSQEQRNAIYYCLSAERVAAVIGYAGAGKSTMLSAAHGAWKRQGLNVIGAALSGKAADGLETSSGIKSRTLASLEKSWASSFSQLTPNDVLVIDESGMIGTRQMARFVEAVKSSGAKLVLVGDPEQLQPINAGTPFRDICNSIQPSHLTEIHRQSEDWQKQASVDFAKLQTEKALQAYEAHGCIRTTNDTATAIIALIEDYMADLLLNGNDKSRLVLAHHRKDVFAINQAIRSAIKSGGDLANEILITTDHGKRAFAREDRIIFTKNDHGLGVRNGMIGTVVSINESQMEIRLDASSNSTIQKRITIDHEQYASLDHGYATTIHKSQGVTVDHAYVLGSKTMDKHLTYVAMTRHKGNLLFYTDGQSLQKVANLEHLNDVILKEREQNTIKRMSM